jgi:hypothetical protein
MKLRTVIGGVLFVAALTVGSVSNATIVWGSCPIDPNGLNGDEVCADEYDANTCHNTSGDLNECNCIHHDGTWDGDNGVCN